MFGVMMLSRAALTVAVFKNAIELVRSRFSERFALVIETVEENEEGYPRYFKHVGTDSRDGVLDRLPERYRVYLPAPCGCIDAGELEACEHGNYPSTQAGFDSAVARIREYNLISDLHAIATTRDNKRAVGLLKSLVHGSYESCDGLHVCHIETRKENRSRLAEERREKMEKAASSFARERKIKPQSVAFIMAVQKELARNRRSARREFDYERRAERWMDSRYVGQSQDDFWSDEDYIRDKFSAQRDHFEGMLDWIRSECPLLWARYTELRLRQRAERRRNVGG